MDRLVDPQPLPFVLSLSASCELPQKDSEHSWAVWYVLASLPRPLQNVLPLVHSNQAISDDGSAMPPRQVRAWSVLLLQIFFLSESDKSARQGEALQVRRECCLAVFVCPSQHCLERENCFCGHTPGTVGVQGAYCQHPSIWDHKLWRIRWPSFEIAPVSFPVCLPGNKLEGSIDIGGGDVSLPRNRSTFRFYLKLIAVWYIYLSSFRYVYLYLCRLVLHLVVPSSGTMDILGLGDWQALNLVIFIGLLSVKVKLSLHLAVPSATVQISWETAMSQ